MKTTRLFLICILFVTSCKEQIAKFLFDPSKVNTKTDYYYNYNSDRLVSSTEKTYTYLSGVVIDSMVLKIEYKYNDKGLLKQEITKADLRANNSFRLFDYNASDSLIRELTINSEGDTTRWKEYDYYPDGRKIIFNRDLMMHADPNLDFEKVIENKMLDTILYRNIYDYENKQCKSLKQFGKNSKPVRLIKYEYSNNKLTKEIQFSYLDTIGLLEKTKYYNYSKSEKTPDYFSLDSKNDTVESKIIIYDNVSTYAFEHLDYGNFINETFSENGKEIGFIGTWNKNKFKTVESREYYDNGKLKSLKTYSENFNAP